MFCFNRAFEAHSVVQQVCQRVSTIQIHLEPKCFEYFILSFGNIGNHAFMHSSVAWDIILDTCYLQVTYEFQGFSLNVDLLTKDTRCWHSSLLTTSDEHVILPCT